MKEISELTDEELVGSMDEMKRESFNLQMKRQSIEKKIKEMQLECFARNTGLRVGTKVSFDGVDGEVSSVHTSLDTLQFAVKFKSGGRKRFPLRDYEKFKIIE